MARNTSPGISSSIWLLAAGLVFFTAACGSNKLKSGKEKDEAMRAGRTPQSMPAADEDYFHDMDGGIALTPEEIEGPQHVDRLDRRQRSLLGRDLGNRASARSTSSRRCRRIRR